MTSRTNEDVARLYRETMAATTVDWIVSEQPVPWRPDIWQREWRKDPVLPHSEVIGQLERELAEHGKIRRRFVFDLADRDVPLLIAAIAWGRGEDGRGPWHARKALSWREDPAAVIAEARTAMFTGGIRAAYRAMFSGNKSRQPECSTAYVTKILHFMAYESDASPRPLIYDSRVATALARIAGAPARPAPAYLSSRQYVEYCTWAQSTSSDPIVAEYALFTVGELRSGPEGGS
jgi:hypothetical protein